MNSSFIKAFLPVLCLLFISIVAFSQNPEITFNLSTYAGGYNVSCHGNSNGSIDATIAGGQAPYTYHWSTGATTEDLSGKPAATYTLTVTDNASHQSSKSVTLTEPNTLNASLQATTYGGSYNISKYGATDGSINTNVSGGSTPYTYSWSNGPVTAQNLHVAAGTYTVTVTDMNGCSTQKTKTLTQPPLLQITSITSSTHNGYNISCNGGNDGAIDITVTGGVTSYSYSWSNGNLTEDISNLAAGSFTVIVTDANGATATSNLTLTQPSVISISTTPSTYPDGYNVSCYNCFNGSIASSVSGGISPYTYLWSGGQTTSSINTLGGGTYVLTVTDASSCTKTGSRAMTEPGSNDWTVLGNVAIDTASQFIGTTDNKPIIFKTNNTEVMRATSGGNVQVGSLAFNSADHNAIHLVGNLPNGTLTATQCQYNGTPQPCEAPVLGWYYNSCVTSDNIFKSPTTGNVGIGTDGPGAKLDIVSDGSGSGYALQVKNSTGTSLMQLKDDGSLFLKGPLSFGSGMNSLTNGTFFSGAPQYTTYYLGYNSLLNSANNQWTFSDDNTVNGGSLIVFDGSGNMRFVAVPPSSSGSSDPQTLTSANLLTKTVMMIKSNGQVGIDWDFSDAAHQVTGYKLAVNGKIISTGARVQSTGSWPDYVFEQEHSLMPLKELEQYVYEYKHLPNLPTADDVSKEGIDLGEMNRLLVEKVEELSLYIIDLQKQVDELKK